ncbi:MAG: hypothetical protein ABIM99_01410 [Candidatus Dojkabacteria bacterium]
MGLLKGSLDNRIEALPSLEEVGIQLVRNKEEFSPTDTCEDYAANHLRVVLNIPNYISNDLIIAVINKALCVDALKTHKSIPDNEYSSNFIVVYINFFLNNFYLLDLDHHGIEGASLAISHWAKVEEIKEGIVIVTSKLNYEGVYKHTVNNPEILETYCVGRNSFSFIDIKDLASLFKPYMSAEC